MTTALSEGKIIILGSGTSEGVPVVSCLTEKPITCKTCKDAITTPNSKNRRRNTSLAIQFKCSKENYKLHQEWIDKYFPKDLGMFNKATNADTNTTKEAQQQMIDFQQRAQHRRDTHNKNMVDEHGNRICNIVVDVGKFFYQSAIDIFPKFESLVFIDSIIITHAHFDAVGGFDDVRDWTSRLQPKGIPVLLRDEDLTVLSSTFPYLTRSIIRIDEEENNNEKSSDAVDNNNNNNNNNNNKKETGGSGVSALHFFPILQNLKLFNLLGISFLPLEVYHGATYKCLGFAFGKQYHKADDNSDNTNNNNNSNNNNNDNTSEDNVSWDVVYLSDVSKIPVEIEAKIKNCRLLIIDALSPAEFFAHPTHFMLRHTIAAIKEIKPTVAYLTGLCHFFNHEEHSSKLAQLKQTDGIDVNLCYDGLALPFFY